MSREAASDMTSCEIIGVGVATWTLERGIQMNWSKSIPQNVCIILFLACTSR